VEGITRDRVYGSYDWLGKLYDIIDTGGFVLNENDIMNKNIKIFLFTPHIAPHFKVVWHA